MQALVGERHAAAQAGAEQLLDVQRVGAELGQFESHAVEADQFLLAVAQLHGIELQRQTGGRGRVAPQLQRQVRVAVDQRTAHPRRQEPLQPGAAQAAQFEVEIDCQRLLLHLAAHGGAVDRAVEAQRGGERLRRRAAGVGGQRGIDAELQWRLVGRAQLHDGAVQRQFAVVQRGGHRLGGCCRRRCGR